MTTTTPTHPRRTAKETQLLRLLLNRELLKPEPNLKAFAADNGYAKGCGRAYKLAAAMGWKQMFVTSQERQLLLKRREKIKQD